MEELFSEFKPSTAKEWKERIIKDLKGGEFEKLVWQNPNGFEIKPFYTSEDSAGTSPVFSHQGWEICEEIPVNSEKEANERALKALNGGASSIHFILKRRPDLEALLAGISVVHIELCFILTYRDEEFKTAFHSWLDKKGIDAEKLNGAISYDGLGNLVEKGNWFLSAEKDLSAGNTWVNASHYQNAGATQSFELACALAHAHEYLVYLRQKKKFRFTVSIGSDLFSEIAKLRALRKLWTLIAAEYKTDAEIRIHAVNSELNLSALDAYNNMLRTTTEGMSAVIGGCNSLTLQAYNATFETPNEFGQRIARNQQMIYKEESYLDKVADIGAGSYYIEVLTDELAAKAWEEFKAIESRGGMVACLRSNYIQSRIKEQAGALIAQFREEKIVLVGVNKFQNRSESARKAAPKVNRIHTGLEIVPLNKVCLSDHLVKENA